MSTLMIILHKERLLQNLMLFMSMCTFFGFGLFHLAQFETTDEHLWKYDRIPQYWHAIQEQKWKKTYINDKPGVTVALFSGIGLLFEPHPEDQFPQGFVPNSLIERYDPHKTLRTNFFFRLPVLIFATSALYVFFVLIRAAYGARTALIATILLSTNPILIGMSQIINPDSFFWIFGGLSICAYIAHVHKDRTVFLVLCGIFLGFSLLSKYTAFAIFSFFVLYECGFFLFNKESPTQHTGSQMLTRTIKNLTIIFIIACTIFTLFLPAVLFDPSLMFKGITQFLTIKKIVFGFCVIVVTGAMLYFHKASINKIFDLMRHKNHVIVMISSSLFLCVFVFNFLNVWTDQKMIPFDNLRDAVYANEPQSFNFKPFLTEDPKLLKKTKVFFLEFYPLMFSLTPLLLITVLGGTLWSLVKKAPSRVCMFTFSATSFLMIYFLLTVIARVVVNVRYSIVLYPIITLWTALIIRELFVHLKIAKKHAYGYLFFILAIGAITLWQLRPFYFSYTNFFLPQKFSIHDSWGHGSYEAAQYLNALPHADQLIIWSNSDTVCRFFVGSCLRSRRIDLAHVTPDYFVISKRGAIKERNHFILENNPHPDQDAAYYFSHLHDRAIWILQINDRPDNYMLIIPYEKN